jgi:RNA polymerase nonessential primary-like sigma factor
MTKTSFYINNEYDRDQVPEIVEFGLISSDEDQNEDSLEEDAIGDKESLEINKSTSSYRSSGDLVRLYLQEIGRIPLLSKEEEVSESQKIQRYSNLLELRSQSAKNGDEVIEKYENLLDIHDRLASHLGYRPALQSWAKEGKIPVTELKPSLAAGKARWAQIANLTIEELDHIEKEGKQAKEHMIKANLRLVVSVAKKYQSRGMELLDLIQEGTLGLERGVAKFDPQKGYRFSTYAYWWIRQGITRALATQSRTIRLPVHITEKLNKIKKVQRKLSQEKGRTPTLEDIGKELNMTVQQIRDVLMRIPRSVSLDVKVGKEKDTELGDLLESEEILPEQLLVREALRRELLLMLDDLNTREKDVISMRFGLRDGHPYSLAEIGRALDLSRERVRQIESKALQKLRQPKRRNRVRDYLEVLT